MKKVTYNMYSCDTCCMSRENDGNRRPRLCHVSKFKRRDMDDIFGILNEEKDKIENSCLLKLKKGRKRSE